MAEEQMDAHEQGKRLSPGLVLGITLIGFCLLMVFFVGRNDYLAVLFIIASTILIFLHIFYLKMGIRAFAKDLFRKGSAPHNWLSKEKSVFQFFMALTFSISISLGFAVVLKTLTIVHSTFIVLLILFFTCLAMRFFSSKDLISGEMKIGVRSKKNNALLQDVMRVFYCTMVLNISMVLFLSAHDTHLFYSNESGFSDFSIVAQERAIERGNNNAVSRAVINLNIILDAFKNAAVNETLSIFDIEKGAGAYFWFFIFIAMLNFLKFLPVSLAVVFIYFAMRNRFLAPLQVIFDSAKMRMEKAYLYIKNKTSGK